MAWQDWTPVTSNDYMQIAFIKQAYDNQVYLHNLIINLLGYIPPINSISTASGTAQQPFPAYINPLEDNLTRLSTPESAPNWYPQVSPAKHWYGELMDMSPLNYADVNRWFFTLAELKAELESVTTRYRISGTFVSSGDGMSQRIRRA